VLGRPNHGHETEFEVRVLGSDAGRAQIAIHQALDETEDD
jgi:hypothetical protein